MLIAPPLKIDYGGVKEIRRVRKFWFNFVWSCVEFDLSISRSSILCEKWFYLSAQEISIFLASSHCNCLEVNIFLLESSDLCYQETNLFYYTVFRPKQFDLICKRILIYCEDIKST